MSATPIAISDLDSLSEPFTPPTRPQSALSVASDTSHFALHDEGEATAHPITNNPPTEYLPFRMIVETIRRHKGQCLLCGRKDDLTVMRAILQHGVGAEQPDPISWLQGLKALPVEYTRDEWTNLMTLCKPHARAYEDNVWRWVPGAAFRAHMAEPAPVSGAATPSHAASEDGEADEMDEGEDCEARGPYSPSEFVSGTTVDDGISGQTHNPEIRFQPVRRPPPPPAQVELPYFDVLVLVPELMPAAPTLSGGGGVPRVWRDWRPLTVNPYVAYAAALPLLQQQQQPPSGEDAGLRQVAEECLAVHAAWEGLEA
ncbi:uncharacterized protein BXZ73DRAFT_41769 [Epithele typhae]|uniref:uncharacterized protein n=1 Tax=Epithele typhae TaxID=378194 RepID=UPI002007F916|nr:uncharacterized protein BXZ73DRAFT_41769 [Epithele typhae]KAH9941887.1 hypothetical protein BXZ73DRAFT_41769 [Epithele typhae]